MKKYVFVLFRCDVWLSTSNKELIAVCSTHEDAESLAFHDAIRLAEEWTDYDTESICDHSQTQGGNRDYNWMIEKVALDEFC